MDNVCLYLDIYFVNSDKLDQEEWSPGLWAKVVSWLDVYDDKHISVPGWCLYL